MQIRVVVFNAWFLASGVVVCLLGLRTATLNFSGSEAL